MQRNPVKTVGALYSPYLFESVPDKVVTKAKEILRSAKADYQKDVQIFFTDDWSSCRNVNPTMCN